MTKAAKFSKWKNNLSWAQKYNEEKRAGWKKAVALYEAHKDGTATMKVPELWSVVSTWLPSIFSALPKVIAMPSTPGGMNDAKIIEKIIQKELEKADVFDDLQNIVNSAIVKDSGFAKLGVNTTFEETESGEIPTGHSLFIDYVPNDRGFVDPEAKNFEDSKFFIHRITMSEAEFVERFGKGAVDKAKYQTVKTSEADNNEDLTPFKKSSEAKRYEVFEIWDAVNKHILVMCEGCDQFLEDEPWPPGFESLPFGMLTLSIKDDDIYSVAEVLLMGDASEAYDLLMTRKKGNAESAQSGFMHRPGSIKEEQKEVLVEPGEKKLVEVDNPDDLRPYEFPGVPQEVYAMLADLRGIMQNTTHVSSMTRQMRDGKKTATEVSAMSQSANVLTAFKVRRFEKFFQRLMQKLVPLIKTYYTVPQLIKMTGNEWYEWEGRDIGEYTFSIEAGSTAFQNEAIQIQQSMQLLALIKENAQFIPNLPVLMEEILRKQFKLLGLGAETVNKGFEPPQPQPQPVAQPQPEQPPRLPPLGAAIPHEARPPEEIPPEIPIELLIQAQNNAQQPYING